MATRCLSSVVKPQVAYTSLPLVKGKLLPARHGRPAFTTPQLFARRSHGGDTQPPVAEEFLGTVGSGKEQGGAGEAFAGAGEPPNFTRLGLDGDEKPPLLHVVGKDDEAP